MSAVFYRFIATRTSYATTIPLNVKPNELVRRVRGALSATAYPTLVGELKDFPLPTAIPNFLLCDGSEVSKTAFPELDAYLGDSEGAAVDPLNFILPDFVGVITPAPTYPEQVVEGGTVSTGGVPTEPTTPGQTGGTTGGRPVSGGRSPNPDEREL